MDELMKYKKIRLNVINMKGIHVENQKNNFKKNPIKTS